MLGHGIRCLSTDSIPKGYAGAWYAADASSLVQPDRSANGFDGTAIGATHSENIWLFDGNDDRIVFGNILNDVFVGDNAKFTLSVRGYASGGVLLSKLGDSNHGEDQRQFVLRLASGKLDFIFYTSLMGTPLFGVRTADASFADGQEREFTLRYDGSVDSAPGDRCEFLVDGVIKANQVWINIGTMGAIQSGTGQFALGAYVGSGNTVASDPLNGGIKRAVVYPYICTDSDVLKLKNEVL